MDGTRSPLRDGTQSRYMQRPRYVAGTRSPLGAGTASALYVSNWDPIWQIWECGVCHQATAGPGHRPAKGSSTGVRPEVECEEIWVDAPRHSSLMSRFSQKLQHQQQDWSSETLSLWLPLTTLLLHIKSNSRPVLECLLIDSCPLVYSALRNIQRNRILHRWSTTTRMYHSW